MDFIGDFFKGSVDKRFFQEYIFGDFLVRMCLLKAFWKVISPVPVTLKRFFALELVFTFGII